MRRIISFCTLFALLVFCILPYISFSHGKPSNNVLKNKIICIDPGHQSAVDNGTEPIAPNTNIMKLKNTLGTVGVVTKVPEYKLNMDVANKLRTKLEKSGARIVMTRETNDIRLSNIERAKIANDAKADVRISIHADGFYLSSVNGVSILVPSKRYINDSNMLIESRIIAKNILKQISKNTSAKSRGVVERDDITGFNWSVIPVILIEMGFMSNPKEDVLLNSSEYQDKIVKGIVEGLEIYFS